jgi:signal transduction histidine kinase
VSLRPGSRGILFRVTADQAWVGAPGELPAALIERVRGLGSSSAPVPGSHASAAWRTVEPELEVGVIYPWRETDANPWGRGPLIYIFGLLSLAAVGAGWLFAQELAAPLRALERHARRLGRGELDQPIHTGSSDEVGGLANALEASRRSLKQTLAEVRELNASLEERVKTRTAELEQTNAQLARALQALAAAQEAMVNAEKLASLGRLSAGIAHEVNNPLNFVKNALPPLQRSLGELKGALEASRLDPALPDAELAQKARALAERWKALGLEATLAEVDEVVRVMGHGVDRMAQILRALLDFSRQAPEAPPVRFDLDEAVRSALSLLRHDLRDRVQVKVDLGEVRSLVGQPGPLGQVLVNLVKNGAEAIEGSGTIEIRARLVEGGVELAVQDSGAGMSPEALQRAFEPFFSTKPVGKGTGLGLAMVHGIVQKHGGSVRLSSTPGAGTTVTLVLPQAPGDDRHPPGEPPRSPAH